MEWNIRPGRAEDLQPLLALYHDYHRDLQQVGMNYDLNEAALPRVMETRLRSRLILTALAEDETGSLAGFVFCSILRLSPEYLCHGESSVGFLNDVYVAPAARRQGLAHRLTDYAQTWLREQGVSVMELQILAENDRAKTFWNTQGMKPVGGLYWKYLGNEE